MPLAAAPQCRSRAERLRIACLVCAIVSSAGIATADVTVDTVLSDLHRPRGIAIRPGGTADRFEIFIADTNAGRIVRWSNQLPDVANEVVAGFSATKSADFATQTGPMAIGFFDPGLLVVGATQDKNINLLSTYEHSDGGKVLSAEIAGDEALRFRRLDGSTCTTFARARVNEFVSDQLFLTVRAADGSARLWSARVQAGTIREPKQFGSGPPAEPRAAAISNSGRVVVADADARLIFYSPVDGDIELALATDLKQPLSLAYNPSSGSLYAADFARGIYRIDDASQPGKPACRTVKVADVNQPTAFAFGPDGALYVLTFGTGSDNGALNILTGEL